MKVTYYNNATNVSDCFNELVSLTSADYEEASSGNFSGCPALFQHIKS